jgi:hypothetical protein
MTNDQNSSARDDAILGHWRAGKHADEIAELVGMPETRVLHELNRILRELVEPTGTVGQA